MFDFDDGGDFDSLDELIEYSVVFDEDQNTTCPSCYATIQVKSAGTISCPGCGASIHVG